MFFVNLNMYPPLPNLPMSYHMYCYSMVIHCMVVLDRG